MSEPLRAKPHALQEGRGVPRYVQLAMLFRRKISSGEWANAAQIPTVDDLAAEHVVARATIRMALGLLEHQGRDLVQRIVGHDGRVRLVADRHRADEVQPSHEAMLMSDHHHLADERRAGRPVEFHGAAAASK